MLCGASSSPHEPFAIHVGSFAPNVGFERPLEDSAPVQVTLVVRDAFLCWLFGQLRGSSLRKRLPCNTLALDETVSKIREIPRGVEGPPPEIMLDGHHVKGIHTHQKLWKW